MRHQPERVISRPSDSERVHLIPEQTMYSTEDLSDWVYTSGYPEELTGHSEEKSR